MPRKTEPQATDLQAWPIDRSRTLTPQMAAAMLRVAEVNSSCSQADLEHLGFTASEVDALGEAARAMAAEERPDLAHTCDLEHAAAFRAQQVA